MFVQRDVPMSKPVILVVDDEVDLLGINVTAIERALPAYDVIGSRSVEEAEAVVSDLDSASVPLALAVVDHVLGGSTGLHLLETLRLRYPDVPVIMCTGRASADVEERARAVGARVLWKPVRLAKFLDEVTAMVGGQAF